MIDVDNDSVLTPRLEHCHKRLLQLLRMVMEQCQLIVNLGQIQLLQKPLLIPEGLSQTIDVLFNPLSAGVLHSKRYSNDPNNPSFQILYGAAVSQVSGSLCNSTWTAIAHIRRCFYKRLVFNCSNKFTK